MKRIRALGLIGAILVLVLGIESSIVIAFFGYYTPFCCLYFPMHPVMAHQIYHYPFYPYMIMQMTISLISGLIGIAAYFVDDKMVSGILFIVAAFSSIPVFFGGFGIGFVLLIVAGIITLLT